jgi:TolA-binding protein
VGDFPSAEDVFKLVKNNHSNTREGVYARYFLGKCVMANGRNNEAISYFRDYIKNGKKYSLYNEAAPVALAVAFENERDFKSAAEIYMNLVSEMSSPEKKANFLEKAAKSYELDGKKRKAVEVLEKAIKLQEGLAKRETELRIRILKG